MSRAPAAVGLITSLLVVCGCSSTLPESDWVTSVPEGECVVEVERIDAMGSHVATHHFAADGRVLSGTTRLRYSGEAWERFSHDAEGRVAEVWFYESIAEDDFPCGMEGGCYTPPRRVVAHAKVAYDDAGRITQTTLDQATYYLQDDGSYERQQSEDRDIRYTYDDEGRLIEVEGKRGTSTLTYEGARLTHIERVADYPRRNRIEHDSRDRITKRSLESCTPDYQCAVTRVDEYEYDDRDRPIASLTSDPSSRGLPTRRTWGYEGDRLVRSTTADIDGSGTALRERVVVYTYDDLARLVSVEQDGSIGQRRRYTGRCDAVTTPPPLPSPLDDIGARPCFRSPGNVFDTCWQP